MNADTAALAALEQRGRTLVAARVNTLADHFGAYLAAVIHDTPTTTSGAEVVSRNDVHTTLATTLNSTETDLDTTTHALATAAAALATVHATRDLTTDQHPDDHNTATAVALAALLALLTADLRAVIAATHHDINTAVINAYTTITAGPDTTVTAARVLTTNAALHRALARLRATATTITTTAVHRGYTNTQLALYTTYHQNHPGIVLYKTWQVRALDPCPSCAALDGTTIDINAEFDHHATTTPTFTPPRVHTTLHGPPRHPNCRCRLVFTAHQP